MSGKHTSRPLGPRHIAALKGLSTSDYTGFGNACTFHGKGGSPITSTVMAGLVDRGLADVSSEEQESWPPQWKATITDAGRAALAEREESS